METDRYGRRQIRSCRTCIHWDECRDKYAAWYPRRGYGPCPHYAERPLSDEDY